MPICGASTVPTCGAGSLAKLSVALWPSSTVPFTGIAVTVI